jgi:hypothetical protein
MSQVQAMEVGQTIRCLEVLQAVQTDSRTSGWYWGDVRGKSAIGAATGPLWRKDLICPRVGSSPFRLTPKGEAFLNTHRKAWEAFLTNTDRPATLAHFSHALTQMPEVQVAPDALP